MRDVLPELMKWWDAGDTIGVGTVVATFQSAPRPPGASMLVGPDETAVGSVSGGCVEGAVYELAQSVVESGSRCSALRRLRRRRVRGRADLRRHPRRVRREGLAETFPELGEIAADIEAGRPVALATVIEHPDPAWLGRRLVVGPAGCADDRLWTRAARAQSSDYPDTRLGAGRRRGPDDAMGLLAAGHNATLTYGPDGERRGEGMRVFVWAFAPKPRLLVFGAIDFAAAVARVGAFLGYHVTVCDARPVFATTAGSRRPTTWSSTGRTAT